MTQRKLLQATLLIATIVIITGCDSIPFIDSSSDYKGASRGKPLEVPPDLTAASSNDTYSVPGGATYSSYSQNEANQPQEAEKILPTSDSVRFERAGSQRWLVVQAPPEKVWPVIREFWTELGFAVRIEDPKTGVMETEWIDPADLVKDDKGNYLDKFQGWLDKLEGLKNRQKFRTRIDRGSEEATTEIYMSHRSISDVADDGHEYVTTTLGKMDRGFKTKTKADDQRSIAEDIDAELLRRLMVRLGVEEKKSRTLIASPVIEKRATISQQPDGTVDLALNDQFDRAWRRVGLALDRIGFLVEDRDRSRGVFFVRYSDIELEDSSQNDKGLLDKLKFWGDDDKNANKKDAPKPEPRKDDKPLADKLKFWGSDDKDKNSPEQQYSVKVEQIENGSQVTVTDRNGKRDKSATANRILSMLYDQLK